MRLSDVLGVRRNLLRKRIITLGIIVSGALSLAFTLITFYGQQAGNFIMTVDTDLSRRGIHLSEDTLFRAPTTRLMTDPVAGARDLTYSWLKIDEALAANGQYTDLDYKYIAYTFYIQNSGNETIDIAYNIRISDVYKNIDEAIRFVVIEDDTIINLYQKEDRPTSFGVFPEYFQMPVATNFITAGTVARSTIENFQPGQIKKFTIIIYLEGQDPDTNDEVLGGMMKAHMNFSILLDE